VVANFAGHSGRVVNLVTNLRKSLPSRRRCFEWVPRIDVEEEVGEFLSSISERVVGGTNRADHITQLDNVVWGDRGIPACEWNTSSSTHRGDREYLGRGVVWEDRGLTIEAHVHDGVGDATSDRGGEGTKCRDGAGVCDASNDGSCYVKKHVPGRERHNFT
jgi:hypothetical protein